MNKTLLLASFLATAHAFAPSTTASLHHHRTSALALFPDQAAELVAASNRAYQQSLVSEDIADVDDYVDSDYLDEEIKQVLEKGPKPFSAPSAARAFVTRVFSLPSSLIKRHPHPVAEGLEDVVLFPLVGTMFVKDEDDHFRSLPTITNPSCRLPQRDEPLWGVYSAPHPTET